jgi:hypothetical protein
VSRSGLRTFAKGWQEAKGALRSDADIIDEGSLAKVREYKKAMKAAAQEGA